uniref:WAP domain-containing protein n=1 Tax=Astyanax mexicanus TaxID=7994 RepID=A0A3B1IDV4_ASTMX
MKNGSVAAMIKAKILNLNRSAEFTAKPGVCPHAHPGLSPGPVLGCEWDTDCPGWQKCCQTENSLRCVDPHTQVKNLVSYAWFPLVIITG